MIYIIKDNIIVNKANSFDDLVQDFSDLLATELAEHPIHSISINDKPPSNDSVFEILSAIHDTSMATIKIMWKDGNSIFTIQDFEE